ncbi:hypothetical protein LINPERPRIM_LOCUS2878 [Linum perenne]
MIPWPLWSTQHSRPTPRKAGFPPLPARTTTSFSTHPITKLLLLILGKQ